MSKRKQEYTVGDSPDSSKRASVAEAASSYNSDEEPPPVAQNPVRNWRLDPEESLSDWTIELVVNDKTHATYHVHKVYLAVGPRRSDYFVKLFSDGGRFAESKDTTSCIELEELAADSFPILLDYLYSEVAALPVKTNNATALHSMAKYFEMRRLRWEAKQFWQKDVKSVNTCGTYYEHARILKNDKILQAATEACSQNIMKITTTSSLMNVTEPSFWLEMLKNKPPKPTGFLAVLYFAKTPTCEQFSCHMSTLIAKLTENHPDLGLEMFHKLTDTELLPHIHHEAALPLINVERTIMVPDETSLSCLQRRCIAALVQNWGTMDLQSQGSVMMELAKKQSPVVLAEILSGTLAAAKQAKTKLECDLASSKREVQAKTNDLEAQRVQLANFHRFSVHPNHVIENGLIPRKFLPKGHLHAKSGANVELTTTNITGVYSVRSCPLFYYKP